MTVPLPNAIVDILPLLCSMIRDNLKFNNPSVFFFNSYVVTEEHMRDKDLSYCSYDGFKRRLSSDMFITECSPHTKRPFSYSWCHAVIIYVG